MDSFNGYKLKPETHIIKPGDIVIRIKEGTTSAPIGSIGIVLEDQYLSLPHNNRWLNNYYEDWRAIETKPGSEAKAGDTAYCIKNRDSCKVHDLFIISRTTKGCISPVDNHKLLSGELTKASWTWWRAYFVVLIKADSQSEFPCFRQGNIRKHIVKFTSKHEGSVVHVGNSIYKLYSTSTDWVDYSNTDTWTPCEDPSNQKEIDTTQNLLESFPIYKIKTGEETICLSIDDNGWYKSIDSKGITTRHNPKFYTLNKPKQTNSKGKRMNSNLFTDILKLLVQTEQTDLEKAPSAYAFFYNEDGEYEGTAKVTNEAEATALLQRPEHLGYTMRIYSFSDEFTTQIPIVSTIKSKTPVTKKPRATKAK